MIFTTVMLFITYKRHEADSERSVILVARALSLTVDREIATSIELLNALGVSRELDVGDIRGFYDEALRFLSTQSAWQTIVLLEPSGQQIINLRRPFGAPLPGPGVPELAKQATATGRPLISNLFHGGVTGAPTIAVIVPILREGSVRYLLSTSFSPENLTKLMLKQNLPPDWLATIIDRQKIIIARSRNLEKYLGKPSTPLFAEMSEKAAEIFWKGTPHDGEPVLAGLHRSELTGWTIGVAAPLSAVDAPFQNLLRIIGFGVLFLLIGGVLALLLSRKITSSITRLGEAARQLASGDLNARVGPVKSTSELEELSRLFDHMGQSLQLRRNQLVISHKLSQNILSGQSLEALSQETLQALLSSISLDFGSVRIVNPDRRSLRVLAAAGFRNPELISTGAPVDKVSHYTAGYRIINTGKSYVAEDIPGAPGLRTLKREGGKSAIRVPIISRDESVIGVLHVVSRTPREFNETEIKFVESIGVQLGIAIERKQAEEEREELIIAQSHAMPGISRLDAEGRYLYVSEAYGKMLGYEPRELLGVDWRPAVHPEDQPKALMAYDSMLRHGQGEFEARALCKDGGQFHKQVLMVKIVDHKGDFVGHHCFMKDISERKESEEELQTEVRRQEAVALFGELALGGAKIQDLMEKTVELVAGHVQAEFAKVLEILPDGNFALLRAGVGWKAGSIGQEKVPLGKDSQAGFTLLSGEPVIVNDLASETRFTGPALLKDHGIVSGVSVIIGDQQRPFGILGVHTKEKRIFNQKDVHFVQAIAHVLGQAIRRDETEQKLRETEYQLRALAQRTERIVEEEKARMSRDIHDSVGQLLTALKLDLSWLKAKLPAADYLLRDKLVSTNALLEEATATVRQIATEMRPPVLDDLGLIPAMKSQLRDFQTRSGINCYFQSATGEPQLPSNLSTTLFRCFQEILSNVARHAEADQIDVSVSLRQGSLVIEVTDNGRGIEPEKITSRSSLGLLGMRERLELVGGRLDIRASDGKGTKITLEAPLLSDPVQLS
jgi:PAS domain S-box-containing protein